MFLLLPTCTVVLAARTGQPSKGHSLNSNLKLLRWAAVGRGNAVAQV
jgi:hypothetical protein